MLRPLICTVLVSLLFTSGCGNPSRTAPAKDGLPALEGEWTIRLAQSGGIMGLSRSIEISSDGAYAATDQRADKTIPGKLSADELEKLREIVTNAEYEPVDGPQGSGCADCFVYDLEIQAGVEKFMVRVDDVTMPDSGMEQLIRHLRDLLEAALNNM